MTDASVHKLTLEPGNSTRYDLDVIIVGPEALLVILYKHRVRIAGRAMKFMRVSMQRPYKPSEVAKTMGCDATEAAVILACLRNDYGLRVDLGADFNQDTGVWVGHTVH